MRTLRTFLLVALVWLGAVAELGAGGPEPSLEKGFRNPPVEARPWVYWFWLNGNITSNGITADLEAMRRVGIGGALIMEVDQGAPLGPVDFMGTRWRALFGHVQREATRLGLEINMNNDAGWNGSGGPWILPEQSMQELTWSETNVVGPIRFEGMLGQPATVANFYRDIAVQAFPATGGYRVPDIESKASFQRRDRHAKGQGELTPGQVIDAGVLVDLTGRMDAVGRLVWDVPAGEWTILRVGHTSTGVENAPAPKSGRGLECDKLGAAGIEANFGGLMQKLAEDAGLLGRPGEAGLVATHIDSWENGAQNWTTRMREEFLGRRGYDLLPFLPVFTGRVVRSAGETERFLWDVRRTVSELVIENYAGRFRDLAHEQGLRFTAEAYGGPCDHIPYGGQADEPMGEFWTPGGNAMETCRGMASAGHVYGKRIIGAEAFTSGDQERWREHPALLKALGDTAFCEGINRFVFHRYALQPWADYRPGMTMGPWGQHYERTQTWWEWTPAWHEYLARCQFMLRQGLFVADICHVQAEAPPHGFGNHRRDGYGWDECTDDAVRTRMTVRDGRVMLPDGMSYRVLALSEARAMTPGLLRRLKELVEAGATVVGPRPVKSPSLSGYPHCDQEVERLAGELWGRCDGEQVKENRVGLGRIVWGRSAEEVLKGDGVPADFECNLPWRYIHRSTGDTDIYFVANGKPFETTATCTFRVEGKAPELWWPESGRMEEATVYARGRGVVRMPLTLGPSGSVLVVFRRSMGASDPVVEVRREWKAVLSSTPTPAPPITVWSAHYGVLEDAQRSRDVKEKVQKLVNAGDRSIPVSAMADEEDPAYGVVKTLSVSFSPDGNPVSSRMRTVRARDGETVHLLRAHADVQVVSARYGVLDDPKRTRDVREKLQRLVDTGETGFQVARMAAGDDPAYGVVKTLEVDYTLGGARLHATGTDPDEMNLVPEPIPPRAVVTAGTDRSGAPTLEAFAPGAYEWSTASGRAGRATVPLLPAPVVLGGPWEVWFDPRWGGPERVIFDQLEDWSKRPEEGIRHYSGTAQYRTTFHWTPPGRRERAAARVWLDLGQVEVMADVRLNGRRLGMLWKPPYRVDVTEALKGGGNQLEIHVVNLWINRLIGDEQLPEDTERNEDGTLKSWPSWVNDGLPSPRNRYTFTSWRLWKKDSALAPSGLLGPVVLGASTRVNLK